MINKGNPVRNIGKNPDVKTINEVPKSGCWKIKKETNKTATREMSQSEYFGFNSFLVKKATILEVIWIVRKKTTPIYHSTFNR